MLDHLGYCSAGHPADHGFTSVWEWLNLDSRLLIGLIIAGAILCGICLLLLSFRQKRKLGLPKGRLVYADPGLWGKPEKPFYSAELGLTGKPDYIVNQHSVLLPVEVKSGWAPPTPYDSHIFQLAAYCLLIKYATQKQPPYGLLKYRNRTFAIDYTPAMQDAVLGVVNDIRQQKKQGEALRSHQEPRRCARCGYRYTCDQRL